MRHRVRPGQGGKTRGVQAVITLVTGASRGIGRGIAYSLGEAKATVYLSGRTAAGLDSAAGEIERRGGKAIPVVCDHTDDAQVEVLFNRIPALDLLVNNVWGGYENHPNGLGMEPFWKMGMEDWDGMFTRGLRAHIAASRLAIPRMLPQGKGLIVTTIAWLSGKYLRHLYYDLAKQGCARLAYALALELKPHGIASVALAPGFVRTEAVMAAHAKHPFDLSGTESPEYIGRAVVHLARDAGMMSKSGRVLTAGDLAREYGFTDVDGKQPPAFEFPPGMALD
ncbi:MAG: SDR family NAD(P)-dependent oxidoreductase [Acidobacteria bacterium]|nr:SDR family NAD(P)-dependent oxidoreductase [Acidobacteriota bacterium]